MEKKGFNMSGFFGKVKDGVVKGANAVADGSEKLMEKGKTKVSILKLQDERRDKIVEIGKLYYETYLTNDKNMGRLYDLCEEVTKIDQEIEKLKQDDPEEGQPEAAEE